jgi:hypothetical protein
MARYVNFNGKTLYHPGGLTRVNANALSPTQLGTSNVLGIIGESDGGAPGSVSGPVIVDDPALAGALFGSGPLADSLRIAFDPSADRRIPGGAFRCICYKVNNSTPATTHLPDTTALISDTDAGTSTTTVIALVTGGLTINAHKGRWLLVASGEKRRIVSNTATTVTVLPGFSAAPTAASAIKILNDSLILTSVGYGLAQNSLSVEVESGVTSGSYIATLDLNGTVNQSPELGGTPWLDLMYVGGPITTNGTGIVTAATTGTVTYTPALAPTLNAFAGMVLQMPDGSQRLITGNTAASPTVVTLDPAHVITTVQAAALVGQTVNVRNVTAATASITGANGSATGLTSTVTPTGDNLAIVFSAGMTLQQLVDYVNANTNYRASIPAGINGQTTLMASFDFGTRNTAVDVRFDQAISPATKGNFQRNLQAIIDWINHFSNLATAVRATSGATEGAQAPSTTGGVATVIQDVPVYFVGGARGTSANSDWQAAFDAMLQVRVNQIVPLIAYDLTQDGLGSTATFASVAAQLSDHVSQCAGIEKSERGGYAGGKLTFAGFLAQAKALNNADVELTAQKLTVLNVSGTLVQQPEWSSAVCAAAMRCGAPEVGTSLTYKSVKSTGLSQDTSWSPRSRTQVNQLLAGGCMFMEQLANGVIRWVRDLTTYLTDDNDAFINGDTRDAVRFVAYDLRTRLEDEFTGEKAKPANANSIRSFVVTKMQEYLDDSIIVTSLDPETQTVQIPGYRNLRIKIDGNIATVRIEIFVTESIVFELNDIYLQLPRIAA